MLECCPRCGYSLRGLPADHACPECGLRYDERSLLFRRRLSGRVWLNLLGFLGGAMIVWLDLAWFMRLGVWRWPGSPYLALAYLGMLAWVAVHIWRQWRLGRMVAVLPEGLLFRWDRPAMEWVPWSNISRVVVGPSRLGVVIFLRRERTTRDLWGVFRSRDEAERLVAAADHYLGLVGISTGQGEQTVPVGHGPA